MSMQSVNPATGRIEKAFNSHGDDEIETALSKAEATAKYAADLPMQVRSSWLQNAAAILRKDVDQIAATMTREMGKTYASARAEVEKCAWVCEFYADNAETFLSDHPIATDAKRSFVRYRPVGPVLAVMPWNFPLWQVFRFAAPAIAAGNVGLLKHASNVPQCALLIEDIFRRAGVPEGGFQTLLISGNAVGRILRDRRVMAATLTGSEGAGRSVAEIAGSELKKVVLELGGSDPFIVMPSADIHQAVDLAVKGRTQNNGQSCIAAKRFLVHSDVYSLFRDMFAERFEELSVGDPMLEQTDIGPLATKDIRSDLDEQVKKSVSMGARMTVECGVVDKDGWFYRPGILENIPDGSPAASEEIFGPVASLFKIESIDDAIARANATRFGLGSAIFTQEPSEMERAFNEIEAGATFVNAITASDPRLPFGGIKASGHGRELAEEGIREFMNVKTCYVAG